MRPDGQKMMRPIAFAVIGVLVTCIFQIILIIPTALFGMHLFEGKASSSDEIYAFPLFWGVSLLVLLLPALLLSGFSHVMAVKFSRSYIYLECFQPATLVGLCTVCFGMDVAVGLFLIVAGLVNMGIGHWIIKKWWQK